MRELGVHDDPGDGQQLRHLARGLGAEDRERGVLGRDEVQLGVDAHLERALGEHQRELVERQRPGAARRGDERDAARVAALDVLDEPVHAPPRRWASRRTRSPAERRDGHGAGGDEQDVVADLLAVGASARCGPRCRRSRASRAGA